jgi:hypothetical protein
MHIMTAAYFRGNAVRTARAVTEGTGVARQWYDEHVCMAANTSATIEEPRGSGVFSAVRSESI